MREVIANCVYECRKVKSSIREAQEYRAISNLAPLPSLNAALASVDYVETTLRNAGKEKAAELRKVINALALELPPAVHKDVGKVLLALWGIPPIVTDDAVDEPAEESQR